jgi:hypothetical protein
MRWRATGCRRQVLRGRQGYGCVCAVRMAAVVEEVPAGIQWRLGIQVFQATSFRKYSETPQILDSSCPAVIHTPNYWKNFLW